MCWIELDMVVHCVRILLALLTARCDDDHRYKLLILAVLSARHKTLVVSWMRITINVHKERRRHQMWSNLHLLVNHILVGVTNHWSVIRVKEHLLRQMLKHTQDKIRYARLWHVIKSRP